MDLEKRLFLRILSDFLHRESTVCTENVDWQKMISYAQKHQVEGILYYQCKAFLPRESAERLTQLYASNLFHYSNRVKQFKQIEQKFSEENIPFYAVKGLPVAQCYPIPALRTMGDCDIVVHPADKERAHEAMLALGYENHQQFEDHEWTYFKNKLEFEIHDHLLYDEVYNSSASQEFSDGAWEHTVQTENGYELNWNFHFVFLLLHLKKHFLYSGVGLRQFMDLTAVLQHHDLDWQWLNDVLQKLELLDFAKACCSFCQKWFGEPMPLAEELDEAFYEAGTEKIFGNGIFGYDDQKNAANGTLNQIRKHGKKIIFLQQFFPPYEHVKDVPYYSFVVGRPWLLPVVWIYRLFRGFRHGKGAHGLAMVDSVVNSGAALEERETMLQKWGL